MTKIRHYNINILPYENCSLIWLKLNKLIFNCRMTCKLFVFYNSSFTQKNGDDIEVLVNGKLGNIHQLVIYW